MAGRDKESIKEFSQFRQSKHACMPGYMQKPDTCMHIYSCGPKFSGPLSTNQGPAPDTDSLIDRQLDRQIDGQIDRETDGRGGWMDEESKGLVGWLDGWHVTGP